jgi:hypothetical protein
MKLEACQATGSTRGTKLSFIAHIIGGQGIQPCLHASDAAKEEATAQRLALGQTSANSDATLSQSNRKRSQPSSSVEPSSGARKKLKQAPLKTYRGVDMPFSKEETQAVQAQVLRAVVSANLSFRAMENPEMLKLFGMLRTAAPGIIPSRKVIGGRLLNEASEKVDSTLERILSKKNLGLS